MKSKMRGQNISGVEILNVSSHGIWLYVKGQEYSLPFAEYPWFKKATIAEIEDVELIHGHHLHWPKLDVDLDFNSLERPENYPLTFK